MDEEDARYKTLRARGRTVSSSHQQSKKPTLPVRIQHRTCPLFARSAHDDFFPSAAWSARQTSRSGRRSSPTAVLLPRTNEDRQTQFGTYRNRSSVIKKANNCYDDLCFGVFALSVEIRPSAAGGTCVSWAITISFAEIFSP